MQVTLFFIVQVTVMIQGRVDRKEGEELGGGEMGRGATEKERQGWGNREG